MIRTAFLSICAAVLLVGQTHADLITYQGRLEENGAALDGTANLTFAVWASEVDGALTGGPYIFNGVTVSEGLFQVTLDIEPDALRGGTDRWLEISINGETLTPRQRVTSAPYSANTRGIDVNADENVGLGIDANPNIRLRSWKLDGGVAFQSLSNGGRAIEAITSNPGDPGSIFTNQDATGWAMIAQNTASNADVLIAGPEHGVESKTSVGGGRAISGINFSSDAGSTGVFGQSSGDLTFAGKFDGRANFTGHTTVGDPTRRITSQEYFGVHTPATGSQYGGVYVSTAGSTGRPFYGYSAGGSAGSADAYSYYDGGHNEWNLWVGLDRITVKRDTGNVGIGVPSPGYKLHVSGSAGKPGGGSWSNSSDARLKKNVADLEGSLDALLSLRGVTYEYIDPQAINELGGLQIGMIAQEVENVFPEWVEISKNGYKTLTFRGFEALTVEAMREIRDEAERRAGSLAKENEALRASVRTLDARVRALEEMVAGLVERASDGGDE